MFALHLKSIGCCPVVFQLEGIAENNLEVADTVDELDGRNILLSQVQHYCLHR